MAFFEPWAFFVPRGWCFGGWRVVWNVKGLKHLKGGLERLEENLFL